MNGHKPFDIFNLLKSDNLMMFMNSKIKNQQVNS